MFSFVFFYYIFSFFFGDNFLLIFPYLKDLKSEDNNSLIECSLECIQKKHTSNNFLLLFFATAFGIRWVLFPPFSSAYIFLPIKNPYHFLQISNERMLISNTCVFKPAKRPYWAPASQEETPETRPKAEKKTIIDNLLPKIRPVALKTSGLLFSKQHKSYFKECFFFFICLHCKISFYALNLLFNEICIERFFRSFLYYSNRRQILLCR